MSEINRLEFLMSDEWRGVQDRLYKAEIDYLKIQAEIKNRPKSLLERIFG